MLVTQLALMMLEFLSWQRHTEGPELNPIDTPEPADLLSLWVCSVLVTQLALMMLEFLSWQRHTEGHELNPIDTPEPVVIVSFRGVRSACHAAGFDDA